MLKSVSNNNSHSAESAFFHAFSTDNGTMLFDVNSGRILPVNSALAHTMSNALIAGDTQRANLMAAMAGINPVHIPLMTPPESAPVRSLSLAVAQKCNLGCTYCYAEKGTFGGAQKNMTYEVAKASVEAMLQGIVPGEHITLAFMGGEPLINRRVLHKVTAYAAERAKALRIIIGFSITTNATLIRPEDIVLFQRYRYTVTVSLDGIGETNDALRPYISGKGSFGHVKKKLAELVRYPKRKFLVLGRVTVTPKNLLLKTTMQGLLAMGLDAIKFSPMLNSPTGKEEMKTEDFTVLLDQMKACGDIFKAEIQKGKILPITNITSMLKRIYAYERENYPCGAGGGYMGVSAEGGLYACHRFVNDDEGHLGDVESGVNAEKQKAWLNDRSLNNQGACTTCWARHLCSGSCHHEVIHRGRPACGYIKGWLSYCLSLYADLSMSHPAQLKQLLSTAYSNETNKYSVYETV